MTARLKRILSAAAVIFVAGAGAVLLPDAIQQANVADVEPYTCEEWASELRGLEGNQVQFFFAVHDGFVIPTTSSTKTIGVCSAGTCTISMTGCPAAHTYEYKLTTSTIRIGPNDWRAGTVTANMDIALAWEEAASENAEMLFLDSFEGVKGRFTAGGFQAAQARTLLGELEVSWTQENGDICRFMGGATWLTFGPGKGGVDANGDPLTCTFDANGNPYPAHNPVGRGWEQRITSTTWADIKDPPEDEP